MVRHIVMFKLREFSNAEEKTKAVEAVRTNLIAMKKRITVIREFEVGINFNPADTAYDLVINSTFASKNDLKIYQVHPAHQELVEYLQTIRELRVAIDYEFEDEG